MKRPYVYASGVESVLSEAKSLGREVAKPSKWSVKLPRKWLLGECHINGLVGSAILEIDANIRFAR